MTTSLLTKVHNHQQAYLILNQLEINGINGTLQNEQFGGDSVNESGDGIHILVLTEQLNRAHIVLEEFYNYELECPYCESTDATRKTELAKTKLGYVMLKLFTGLPFGNLKYNHICNSCGKQFYF